MPSILKIHLKYKDTRGVNWWTETYHTHSKRKKAGVAIFISDKGNLEGGLLWRMNKDIT